MDEINIKFGVKKIDFIRLGLAGIYFLMVDEEVIFIGEGKDIKKDILKHQKRGLIFDTIGIHVFEGSNRERKQYSQALIQKYQPRENSAKHKKIKKGKAKRGPASSPAKASIPLLSRLEEDKPQALHSQPDPTPDGLPDWAMEEFDDLASAEAADLSLDKLIQETEEALEGLTLSSPPSQLDEETPALPGWLQTLEDSSATNETRPTAVHPPAQADDSLPAWTRGDHAPPSQPSQAVESKPASNEDDDDDELPDWMKDIDMSKSSGNSVSPFK